MDEISNSHSLLNDNADFEATLNQQELRTGKEILFLVSRLCRQYMTALPPIIENFRIWCFLTGSRPAGLLVVFLKTYCNIMTPLANSPRYPAHPFIL